MIGKAQFIVLHTIKHGESGLVLQGYSDTCGRQSIYVRGISRKHNGTALFQRLNILEIVVFNSGKSSMPLLREVTSANKFATLRTDIYKSTIAIFISELLLRTIREEEANPPLFEFLSSSVQILEHLEEGVSNFHIQFIVHLCRMLGFRPTDDYRENSLFHIPTAGFLLPGPDRPEAACFTPAQSALLHTVLRTPVTEAGRIRCSGELRLEFTRQMIRYLSHHLGYPVEIKSLDILHEIFK